MCCLSHRSITRGTHSTPVPKHTGRVHMQAVLMPRVCALVALISPSKLEPVASWGILYDNPNVEKALGPYLQMIPHDMLAPHKSGQLKHYRPALGCPWKTVVKKNLSSMQNLKKYASNNGIAFSKLSYETSSVSHILEGWRKITQNVLYCVCSKSETSIHCCFSSNLWNPEFMGTG